MVVEGLQKAPELSEQESGDKIMNYECCNSHKDNHNFNQSQVLIPKDDADPNKYMCVGGKYFAEVVNYDVSGRAFYDNVPINKEAIVDRFGRKLLTDIPYYETMCIVPSHTNYKPIIGRCFNRYYPLPYAPNKGDHPTWDILLTRVFGEQFELGLDYLTIAYRYPTQVLPVLCLVSVENGTGKSSYGNALASIFGRNVGFCSQEDLSSKFNTWIKHLITVFEEISETKTTVNKIKNMSTAKSATLDEKYLPQITFQPFVKIIILSNNDRTFIKANEQDIRYWVRKLEPIPSEEFIPNFDNLLEAEAPAMLHTLATRNISTPKKSRMWFDPAIIATKALNRVRKESRSEIVRDLEILLD